MKHRLPAAVAFFLIAVVGLAIHQIGRDPFGSDAASEFAGGGAGTVFLQKSPIVGELTLVRTPDSEFLNAPVNLQGEPAASEDAVELTDEAAEAPADEVTAAAPAGEAMEGDAKEVKEPRIAGGDGKDFKEMIDPKALPPIADGSDTGGSAGGGGGGGIGGGGGGGGAIPGEVAAFEEVIEVEKDGDTIFQKGDTTVIRRTIIRTVPQPLPITPVPEPGSALIGFAAAALAWAAMLRRSRAH